MWDDNYKYCEGSDQICGADSECSGICEEESGKGHYVEVDEGWGVPTVGCNGTAIGPRPRTTKTFTISQEGDSPTVLPTAFTSNETVEDFYNYYDGYCGNSDFYQFLGGDISNLFTHYSTLTKKMSIVFIHDYPDSAEDPFGGDLDFTISNITGGNRLAVQDDPVDSISSDFYSFVDIGEEVKNVKELTIDSLTRKGIFQFDRYSNALVQGKLDKVNIVVDINTIVSEAVNTEINQRGFTLIRQKLGGVIE